MSDKKIPRITLEVQSGAFTIRTEDVIYDIVVKADLNATRVIEKIVEKEVPVYREASQPPAALLAPAALVTSDSGANQDEKFYEEVTAEIYSEIGTLAKQLSISLKGVSVSDLAGLDMASAGKELESAKGQLEQVVNLTESATMNIIDKVEEIEEVCKEIQNNLKKINEFEPISEESRNKIMDDIGKLAEDYPKIQSVVGTVLQNEETVYEKLKEVSQSAPSTPVAPVVGKPAGPPARIFPLDTTFQTIYELCTNEVVKKHIKTMREKQTNEFDHEAINEYLSAKTAGLAVEDGFLNVPIKAIFESLYKATPNEEFKTLIKKMTSNSEKIFLDQFIPLDMPPDAEPDPSQEDESAGPASVESIIGGNGHFTEVLDLIYQNISTLREKGELFNLEVDFELLSSLGEMTISSREGVHIFQEVIDHSNNSINRVINSIAHILEALSFQDLSGQQIKKIIRILSKFQFQLLAILVNFGTKLKLKKQEAQIPDDKFQSITQDEVDKVMKTLSADVGEEDFKGQLDQDSVNDLLNKLGF
ncbi:MAG: protein phosphatase CheZ [Deltaproteobacteria bacterium]|nr:protein phosphatase CheZ [Deltaproteobacteria bacterium]